MELEAAAAEAVAEVLLLWLALDRSLPPPRPDLLLDLPPWWAFPRCLDERCLMLRLATRATTPSTALAEAVVTRVVVVAEIAERDVGAELCCPPHVVLREVEVLAEVGRTWVVKETELCESR